MSGSPLVHAIQERLRGTGYSDLPTPFKVAGVEFAFTGAMHGRGGRALDLVLLVDTTTGDFGDRDGGRVRQRVEALSRALDVTGSRYVLTVILAGAVLTEGIEALSETCRVLQVESVALDDQGKPADETAGTPARRSYPRSPAAHASRSDRRDAGRQRPGHGTARSRPSRWHEQGPCRCGNRRIKCRGAGGDRCRGAGDQRCVSVRTGRGAVVSDLILKSLDIKNFRSIRGQVHAPLDAKVVLVHGENGAGKTSLLSAVELALTGNVQSLERADPGYEKQLLHRSATEGSVLLRTLAGTSEQSFEAVLNAAGAQSIAALDEQRATFFRERAFLPQSLLGQLLQIYQDAGNDAASPLAQFVGNLLGLDQLDALEAGLKPLADVRNVRKNVDGWLAAENEKSRLDQLLSDQRKERDAINEQVRNALSELAMLCTALQLSVGVREETLDEVAAALSEGSDFEAFARLTDQQRRLASIRREIDAARSAAGSNAALTPAGADEASGAFARWEAEYGERVSALRNRVEGLLPDVSLPSDPEQFAEAALTRLAYRAEAALRPRVTGASRYRASRGGAG